MATALAQDFTAEERQQYIGGSDISAILGQNRWKTPYRLWAEKTGKVELPDLSNNQAVKMGNRLERFVAELFTEETGKSVRRQTKTYRHPKYPFLVAHVDRLITGSDELLECKTCSAYKLEEWENDIPKEYVLQVMWYLGITGRKRGWIACLIGGQKFDYKVINFDAELFNLMVEKAAKFWDMVQNEIPPAMVAEDGATLAEVYPNNSDEMIQMSEINDRVSYLKELEQEIADKNNEVEEIKTELKSIIKDKQGIITPAYKITWKTQTRKNLDTKRLWAEISNIDDFAKISNSRVLRIAKIKKEG